MCRARFEPGPPHPHPRIGVSSVIATPACSVSAKSKTRLEQTCFTNDLALLCKISSHYILWYGPQRNKIKYEKQTSIHTIERPCKKKTLNITTPALNIWTTRSQLNGAPTCQEFLPRHNNNKIECPESWNFSQRLSLTCQYRNVSDDVTQALSESHCATD